jgi:hypothetical protein
MVKSVVVPWMVASQQEGAELSRIFTALGFSDGDGWSDSRSAGAPYLAPLGAIEVIHGTPPAPADLIVEVHELDKTFANLRTLGTEIACEPYDSHWGSRVCIAQIGTKKVAFFEFKQTG